MTSGGVCSTYFNCFVETSLSCEGYSIATEHILCQTFRWENCKVYLFEHVANVQNYSYTVLLFDTTLATPGCWNKAALLNRVLRRLGGK